MFSNCSFKEFDSRNLENISFNADSTLSNSPVSFKLVTFDSFSIWWIILVYLVIFSSRSLMFLSESLPKIFEILNNSSKLLSKSLNFCTDEFVSPVIVFSCSFN